MYKSYYLKILRMKTIIRNIINIRRKKNFAFSPHFFVSAFCNFEICWSYKLWRCRNNSGGNSVVMKYRISAKCYLCELLIYTYFCFCLFLYCFLSGKGVIFPVFEDRTGSHLGCEVLVQISSTCPLASQYCPVAAQTELQTLTGIGVVAIP